MNTNHNHLSYHERILLNLLKKHGVSGSVSDSSDLRDLLSNEIKEFFHRLTHEGLMKLFHALYRKGHLIKDNHGWYRLRNEEEYTEIAILGKITAGHLTEAIGDPLGFVQFYGTIPQAQQLYAFQVMGDSMIGDDIYDGDCVLLRNVEILNGQIGAVIVNGETTLKRIYKENGMLRLVPSNPSYAPVHLFPGDLSSCRILGRLEAIISQETGEVHWISANTAVSELIIHLN